jgi:hypothetical protein
LIIAKEANRLSTPEIVSMKFGTRHPRDWHQHHRPRVNMLKFGTDSSFNQVTFTIVFFGLQCSSPETLDLAKRLLEMKTNMVLRETPKFQT